MLIRKETNNYVVINSDHYGYEATIRMNPRDAMVMVNLTNLPTTSTEQQAALADLEDYLRREVGGKILLELPESLDESVFPAQQIIPAVQYVSAETLDESIIKIDSKTKIADLLLETRNLHDEKGKYDVLVTKEDYTGKHQQLFDFKRSNANSFVTDEKISFGLYSARAEYEKNKNEFTRQIAIYSRENNEFIAVLQMFVADNTVYFSDLIVGEKYRNLGYAQALMCLAHDKLLACEGLQAARYLPRHLRLSVQLVSLYNCLIFIVYCGRITLISNS